MSQVQARELWLQNELQRGHGGEPCGFSAHSYPPTHTTDHLHPHTSTAPPADAGPTCGHEQTQADVLWQNLKAVFIHITGSDNSGDRRHSGELQENVGVRARQRPTMILLSFFTPTPPILEPLSTHVPSKNDSEGVAKPCVTHGD